MSNYTCKKCAKDFKQKSHYTSHINRKKSCINENENENNIKESTDNVVTEKIIEIKKPKPCKFVIVEDEDKLNTKNVKDLNISKVNIPKPLIKWVGGKTQIIDKIIGEFPTEINNYREIFLGGGSVLLALLSYIKNGVIKLNGKIYAYDLNEPLIWLYKNIQSNHIDLYAKIQSIINEFNECGNGIINRKPKNIIEAKISKENYYYWIRTMYNKLSSDEKKTTLGSALFIFLNKTCFRGVFRVGPNGFNVPYGHYENPEIINQQHIQSIHELIQDVIFTCSDFNSSLNSVEVEDFIYLDPPYAPETSTSFVGYTENGFDIDNHNKLFNLIHNLTETHKKIVLSNADVSLVRDNFTKEKYNIISIECKRSINSKKPGSKTNEVIIKNF